MSTSIDRMTKSEVNTLLNLILEATKIGELSWSSPESSSELWAVGGDCNHNAAVGIKGETEFKTRFDGFSLILKKHYDSGASLMSASHERYELQIMSGSRSRAVAQDSGFWLWSSQLKKIFNAATGKQKEASAHAADWG